MSVAVRPCAASNTAAIIALILRIQRDEFGAAVTVADQPNRAAIAEVYLAGDGGFCVAERDGAIGVQDIGDARAALRKMFVAADARGGDLGVAAGLLRSLLEHAAARGLREIFSGRRRLSSPPTAATRRPASWRSRAAHCRHRFPGCTSIGRSIA